MSAFRGKTTFPPSDVTGAIFGLAASVAAGNTVVNTTMLNALAGAVAGRTQTVFVNGVGVGPWQGTEVVVDGLEAADQLVSVIRIVQTPVFVTGGGVADASIAYEDVTSYATVAAGLLTFADIEFNPSDNLIITYVDVTRPNATEL